MDFSKLGNGAKIILIGGIALFITSFLPWYGYGITNYASYNINGWDTGFWGVFGILLGIAAVVVFALQAFEVTKIAVGPFKAEQITFMLGALSLLFILLRWITETSATKFGLFLGILSAAAITFGAFTAMREAGIAMPDMDDFKSMGGGGDEPPPPPPGE